MMKRITSRLAFLGVIALFGFGLVHFADGSRASAQGKKGPTSTAGLRFIHPASGHPAFGKPGINLDPTADIHPSVVLEGNITVGAYSKIDVGSVLTGNVTVGHHTLIRCNVVIRGGNRIGNYTHIYDNVNIEGGRPAKPTGGSAAEVADRSIIGDECWINHGAVMHGTQIGDQGAVGVGAACDYNTRIGKGAILGNGSATNVDQVICDNCLAVGVPAVIKQRNINDAFRKKYFGVLPSEWVHYQGAGMEKNSKDAIALGANKPTF
jgi:carbonic anhydrase/acetyltransferase-like protein (isoleucine patch superfamily)